jgi:hypothetical protein
LVKIRKNSKKKIGSIGKKKLEYFLGVNKNGYMTKNRIIPEGIYI